MRPSKIKLLVKIFGGLLAAVLLLKIATASKTSLNSNCSAVKQDTAYSAATKASVESQTIEFVPEGEKKPFMVVTSSTIQQPTLPTEQLVFQVDWSIAEHNELDKLILQGKGKDENTNTSQSYGVISEKDIITQE